MSFKVTILGSGAALPTAQRNPTSQYIECQNRHILIDCGEGTQMQMRKFGIKLQKISHILISHLHGDHYFGLVGLLSTMHLLGRDKGITIYGPKELEQIIRLQLEIGGNKIGFDLNFEQIENHQKGLVFEDKCIEIHTFPLKHKIQTNGYLIKEKQKELTLDSERFYADNLSIQFIHQFKKGLDVVDENGKTYLYKDYTLKPSPPKSYAFCSDTAYYENIIPSIKDCNVLYHEATFTEKEIDRAKSTLHSTAKQAATIALKANVGKLLMGHLSARFKNEKQHLTEAKSVFEMCTVVSDGDVILI